MTWYNLHDPDFDHHAQPLYKPHAEPVEIDAVDFDMGDDDCIYGLLILMLLSAILLVSLVSVITTYYP